MPQFKKKDPLADHLLPDRISEEATEARENERIASGSYPRAQVTSDEFDKSIARGNDDNYDEDPWSANNPLKAAAERCDRILGENHGQALKLLSPRVCDVLGDRGYETVVDKKGNPVKVGNMFMGHIPQKLADARQRKARNDSNSRVEQLQGNYADAVSRLKSEAGDMGLRVLGPGEIPEGGSWTNTREPHAAGIDIRRE